MDVCCSLLRAGLLGGLISHRASLGLESQLVGDNETSECGDTQGRRASGIKLYKRLLSEA